MDSLTDLQDRLPQVRKQVKTICSVYDSGRNAVGRIGFALTLDIADWHERQAQDLLTDLEWKHTSFQDKCYRIIFTRTSPVSSLEITLFRLAFLLVFVVFAWQLGGVLDGAYRAYQHRLVWGDKIIS